jgi:hypothetical protein
MRFEDITSQETRLKIMTDGTLLQEMKHDPLLTAYSVLMVDEAHESSLNIDFILGLLKTIIAQSVLSSKSSSPRLPLILRSLRTTSMTARWSTSTPRSSRLIFITYELDYGQRQDEALVDRIQMVVEREVVGKKKRNPREIY